jgi:hypothetical protein
MSGADGADIGAAGQAFSGRLDALVTGQVSVPAVLGPAIETMRLSNSHVKMLCTEFYRKSIETPDIKGTVILASFFEELYALRKKETELTKLFYTQYVSLIQQDYDRKRPDVLRCLAALMSNNVLSKTKTIMEVFTDEAEHYSTAPLELTSQVADRFYLARTYLFKTLQGRVDTTAYRRLLIEGTGTPEVRQAAFRILQYEASVAA